MFILIKMLVYYNSIKALFHWILKKNLKNIIKTMLKIISKNLLF